MRASYAVRAIACACLLLSGCGVFASGRPGPVNVTQVMETPEGVGLGVASCNGDPVAVVSDLLDGQYLVEVRTTRAWEVGNECLDVVVIDADLSLDSFEIVDLTSGEVFEYPPVEADVAPAAKMDGAWRMVEVNGEPVEVGVNTIEIPEFTIEAGFLSGELGCNSGGAELLIEGDRVRGFLESTAELCGIPDGSEEMVPTERILSSMLNSSQGFNVERVGNVMSWTDESSNELVFIGNS